MAGLFGSLASVLPVVTVGAVLLLITLGLVRVFSPTLRSRRDRGVAIGIGAAIGLVAGLLMELVIVGVATMDTGPRPDVYWQVAPVAVIGGLLVAGSSIAGYAALTLGSPTRGWALVGTLAGPLLMAGLLAGVNRVVSGLDELRFQAEVDEVRERAGQKLTVKVRDVVATYSDDGQEASVIETLSVTVVLRSSETVRLNTQGKIVWPRFDLRDARGFSFNVDAPPGSPAVLAAGQDTLYPLRFEAFADPNAGTAAGPPIAGRWTVTVSLEDADGTMLELVGEFVVPAAS